MARPREFDEKVVLGAAVQCFWTKGFDGTSIRDLIETTGLTGASLYNAFGDKRSLYKKALDFYLCASVTNRIQRCEELPPAEGIEVFFAEIVKRSIADQDRKGCMLVNTALDLAPHDSEFRDAVTEGFAKIEAFFLRCVEKGQADATINPSLPALKIAKSLLALLTGIRVLARIGADRSLLEGAIEPVMALLRFGTTSSSRKTA